MNKNLINKEIEKIIDKVINIRRQIHMNPEVGYEEVETAKYIAKTLREIGMEVRENVGGNGVVGLIRGAKNGQTVLLRADMDALPIQEENDLEFASKIPGKMHACGHDIHMSIMLGAAEILYKYRDCIEGNIKFMFQPAEECSPDGGAKAMIKDGVMENPKVDYAIATHIMPELEIGQIGITEGAVTAQSDSFKIKVIGKSGHASAPHRGVDAIMASANLIMNLQSVITKMMNPLEQAVVSIGKINGGEADNVIADTVYLDGTSRMMTPGYVDTMPDLIKQIADNSCGVYGAKCEVEYVKGYSILNNDPGLVEIVKEVSLENFGKESIVPYPQCAGGEDFAFVGEHAKAMFIWLGSRTKGADFVPQHNGKVIFDEECISIGMKTVIGTVCKLIKIENK